MNLNNLKIAIVQDDLMRKGGGEKVALQFHLAFPTAPIYTLCYQAELTYPEFKKADIRTSLYQKFVKTEPQMKKWFYPLGYWCMRLLKLKEYDIILLSSTYAAKYIRFSKNTLVINYCHNPFRLAWYPTSYSEYANSSGLKKKVMTAVVSRLKRLDFKAARKIPVYIANSKIVATRIEECYQKKVEEVINPSVELTNFSISNKAKDYFLVVSRLEFYKKIDLVIEVFNENKQKLIVVGRGSKKKELHAMANANIEFKENLSNQEIASLYANAKALLFPQEEDFGITPLEANASGTPVIAYGKGGVLETMTPYNHTSNEGTALFFNNQSKDELLSVINQFESCNFNAKYIQRNAERFSDTHFREKIKNKIKEIYKTNTPS